jgi:hypothetical protein
MYKGERRRKELLHSSRKNFGSAMKQTFPWIAALLFLAITAQAAGEKRASLLPKLQAGQKLTYLIRFRSDKSVKTESNVTAPMAPSAAQVDAHGLFQMGVLDVQQMNGKAAIHARGEFHALDSDSSLKKPVKKDSQSQPAHEQSAEASIEFTISPDGAVRQVTGLDAFTPEHQQAWQEWVARFAVAWTLPADGAKIGDKWKSEQAEDAASPIASLTWERESQYVKNEPCRASQLWRGRRRRYLRGALDHRDLETKLLLERRHPRRFQAPRPQNHRHRPGHQRNLHLHFSADRPRRPRQRRSHPAHGRHRRESRRFESRPLQSGRQEPHRSPARHRGSSESPLIQRCTHDSLS